MTQIEKISQAMEITTNAQKKIANPYLKRSERKQLEREMGVLNSLLTSIAKDTVCMNQTIRFFTDGVDDYHRQIERNALVEGL